MSVVSKIAAAMTIGLLSAVSAQAQDKVVELKFSHWVPTQHPMHAAAVAWPIPSARIQRHD